MTDTAKRNLVAQWAFDTRPVLLRFHLWLEDVEVERSQAEPVSAHSFAPRGIARCLAMTSAATALGTRLFGDYGGAAAKDKATVNQVKKAADAVSAYVMSEGLWHLTRTLPENHALMVCLGEGLMPKVGETPEMGANPMLGFGRVYARPELAKTVDRRVRRLLNEPGHTFEHFHEWLRGRGITLWGAAVDTLENTSRFADGQPTGPMTVFHLFDSPLRLSRPYESYMGCLTVPTRVAQAAESTSVLLDYRTPRKQVTERGRAAGLPCTLANDVHYPLDYGTVMPLVCYLDRAQRIAAVPVSVCLSANLDESFAWGRHIARAAAALGRRAAFVASGSVSHKLVRGPEQWPGAAEQALDHRLARLLADGDYDKAWAWLPEYAEAAEPEMGGRHLAMMLGALIETGRRFEATVHAYGPSSGSGNYVISLAC